MEVFLYAVGHRPMRAPHWVFSAIAGLFIFSFSVAFCTHGSSVSYRQHCILFLGGENRGVNSVVGSDKHKEPQNLGCG